MPRVSRGCLRCRQRKVKCDLARPICQRCINRNETCGGYRDMGNLIFRHETLASLSTKSSLVDLPADELSSPDVDRSSNPPSKLVLPHDRVSSTASQDGSTFTVKPESHEQAVDEFLDRYALYPSSRDSEPVFLEHLPCLFKEVNIDGRCALRWAVQAAAFADAGRNANVPGVDREVLEYYGMALEALARSLGEKDKVPDDYDLMTVVILDFVETMFLPDTNRRAHVQGMAHILRLRGSEQFQDPRSWSLFRIAHHRMQKEQLAFGQPPMAESEALLDELDDSIPFVRLEKNALRISQICQRARDLVQQLTEDDEMSIKEVMDIVREMHRLDRESVSWRKGPEWAYTMISKSELQGPLNELLPDMIELHSDAWNAYEWNYHRTARIVMHGQLLTCLRRAALACINIDGFSPDAAIVSPLEHESVSVVQSLADQVLASVPQSLGDIDQTGRAVASPRSRAIGGYLLLWPMKIIKSKGASTSELQKAAAQAIFHRIREYTGMKSGLGELSNI
ncbi:hypothetical protein GQ53DRAFT_755226 [Thozetella sp. PMI_491]|nr:hypothetical protein GQ53DRAFT_755226 [Thozetella sp. PMI_491]